MTYLKDDTLHLRAVEPGDADCMWEFENDSTQWRDNGMMAPYSHKNLKEYAENYDADPIHSGQLRLIVEKLTDEAESKAEIIGIVDLYDISATNRTAFIGIYIKPERRNVGYAQRALGLIEKYSHQLLNLRILAAKISERNSESLQLFKKCGYEECGELRHWILCGKNDFSLLLYTKMLP